MGVARKSRSADLIVVGGGPAGLATAIFAALEGLQVTLLERRRFPVDKPCGEGLMPRGVGLLARMGLEIAESRPFLGIRYLDAGTRAEARFHEGPGLGVKRTVLSRAMAERARELGVTVVEGARVEAVENGRAGVRVTVGGSALEAAWAVAADGLQGRTSASGARAGWGPGVLGRLRLRRFGFRCRYRVPPWSSFVEVHWGDGGEAYVTPLGEDEVSVALLWHGEIRPWNEMIARFPDLLERIGGREMTSKLHGAGPLRRPSEKVASGRIALVGDRSGYVDAITGDGVALAFECARALAASLAQGTLAPYVEAHDRAARRYRWMAETVLTLASRPRLRRRVLASLSARPALFDRLLAISADGAPLASLGVGSFLRALRRAPARLS